MSAADAWGAIMDPLVAEYGEWIAANAGAVPRDWCFSADELVLHDEWFTLEQRQWLTRFIDRWDAAQTRADKASRAASTGAPL